MLASELERANAQALCPHCLAEVGPHTHFCRTCGAPLSAIAAIDPLGRVHAEGYGLRNATSRPRSLLVLIGMWLLFAPSAAMMFWIGVSTLLDSTPTGELRLWRMLMAACGFAGGATCIAILIKTTLNYRRSDSLLESDATGGRSRSNGQ